MGAHEALGQSLVEFHGLVCRSLANDLFEVRLADGRTVLAHLSPGARLTALRIGAGDHVRVALARYDHTRGRITGRALGPVPPGGDVGVGT